MQSHLFTPNQGASAKSPSLHPPASPCPAFSLSLGFSFCPWLCDFILPACSPHTPLCPRTPDPGPQRSCWGPLSGNPDPRTPPHPVPCPLSGGQLPVPPSFQPEPHAWSHQHFGPHSGTSLVRIHRVLTLSCAPGHAGTPNQRAGIPRPSGASGKRRREEEEEEGRGGAGAGAGGAEWHLGSWLRAEVQMLPDRCAPPAAVLCLESDEFQHQLISL